MNIKKPILGLWIAITLPFPLYGAVENVVSPWGEKLSINWPAPLNPKPQAADPFVLRWKDATNGVNVALYSLSQPAGSLEAIKFLQMQSLREKSGAQAAQISTRDEQVGERKWDVIAFPGRAPHSRREIWLAETTGRIVTLYISILKDDPEDASRTARSIVEGFQIESSPLTRDQMLADLQQAAGMVKSAWSYAEMRQKESNVDLDMVARNLAGRITEQTTPEQFNDILREFVASMQDGHADLLPQGGASASFALPWRCVETDEGIILSEVDTGTSSIAPGDRLLRLNDTPVEEIIANRMKTMPASTADSRRYGVIRQLQNVDGPAPVKLEVEQLDGKSLTLELSPVVGWGPPVHPSAIEYHKYDDGIGYLRIPDFSQDYEIWDKGGKTPESLKQALDAKFRQLREAFTALHDCPALILDLRDNGGGSDWLGEFLAKAFAPDAKKYYDLQPKISPELLALPEFGYKDPTAAGQRFAVSLGSIDEPPTPFPGKLYVLMNEGSFSATCCFLNFIECAKPETVFVGTPDGAGSGAPRPIGKLKYSGAQIFCCVMLVYNLRGEYIEGHPLTPSIRVRPARADLATGRDTVLEAALSAARKVQQ